MLGITNAGIGKKGLEEMFYQQTLQSVLIATGVPAITNANNLYKNNTASGSYPDSTFKYIFTGEATSFNNGFEGCTNLTSVSNLDTRNVLTMSYLFKDCTSLSSVDWFDTSKCTDFTGMFYNTGEISTWEELDTSNGENFSNMFYYAKSTCIFDIDTRKGKQFTTMFMGSKVQHIPDISFDSLENSTSIGEMFRDCTDLVTLIDNPYAPEGHRWNLDSGILNFSDCPLDRTSILKVFNGVLPAVGIYHSIGISSTTNGYLSADDKAIAENKGWTVTVAA